MIDLHTHSTASDGTLSPSILVETAVQKGITTLALTDHDTDAGLEEASSTAGRLGIRFIPGIEFAIEWKPGEFHLLGLNIRNTEKMQDTVAEITNERNVRNQRMVALMQEAGIKVAYENSVAFSGGHSVGRPHFAAFLINKKIVRTQKEAFDRYLGDKKAFYVQRENLNFDRALSTIHASGGIAVLAHPLSLYVAWGHLPDLVKDLKDRGLDGIEAWHPTATVHESRRLEQLAHENNLYITAGSDFHGAIRNDRKLGIAAGEKKIDESLVRVPW
jgi:predicted metal-dependent phosphoesterase TrpH